LQTLRGPEQPDQRSGCKPSWKSRPIRRSVLLLLGLRLLLGVYRARFHSAYKDTSLSENATDESCGYAFEMGFTFTLAQHNLLAPESDPHFQVARGSMLSSATRQFRASRVLGHRPKSRRTSVGWVLLIGTGPERRPNETFSKGYVVCAGMCGDASDCAPSVSPNATCKSGDAAGSDANPATDPAGSATEADAATKEQPGYGK
jgi:hypothetical protein